MRRLARVALLLAVNALALFGLLELALRAQEPFLHLMSRGWYTSPNYRYAVIDHPIWDHELRPGLRDFELEVTPPRREEGFRYLLRTNRWGCRYGEIALPRPDGVRRVIVIGDSFTEGYREEDMVSQQLERALDAQGRGIDYEVLNCGVSSYSLLTILLRLREQLLQTQPDAVIVNVDLTDLHDDYWRRRPDLRSDADGRPIAVGREDAGTSRLRDFLETWSYAARATASYGKLASRLLRHRLFGHERGDGRRDLYALRDEYRLHSHEPGAAEDFEVAFDFFALQLDRIVALCRESGIACAFSTYPHREQLPGPDGAPPALHREFAERIAGRLAERGVFFYDAYDAIADAYARDPDIYFTRDMHFRPEGQRAWGRAFAGAFAPWVLANAN